HHSMQEFLREQHALQDAMQEKERARMRKRLAKTPPDIDSAGELVPHSGSEAEAKQAKKAKQAQEGKEAEASSSDEELELLFTPAREALERAAQGLSPLPPDVRGMRRRLDAASPSRLAPPA